MLIHLEKIVPSLVPSTKFSNLPSTLERNCFLQRLARRIRIPSFHSNENYFACCHVLLKITSNVHRVFFSFHFVAVVQFIVQSNWIKIIFGDEETRYKIKLWPEVLISKVFETIKQKSREKKGWSIRKAWTMTENDTGKLGRQKSTKGPK